MQLEIDALKNNNIWIITHLPPGKTTIDYKWVCKNKYHVDDSLESRKACLVTKGYTQQEGIDYLDTFSPVAKLTSVKVLLALAALHGWTPYQLDVNNVFLHRKLVKEVYMKPPPGYLTSKSRSSTSPLVCKLIKSIYGLKLSSALLDEGFTQSHSDSTLFTKITTSTFLAILIYTNDILVASNSDEAVHSFKIFYLADFNLKT